MNELIFAAGLIILIVIALTFSYYQEKSDWNNGICKESGKKWVYFDTASDGSRGYTDNTGNHIWVSWGVDK